jgi:DNA-directed RNA polymerase subunit RPC12/RpoP
MTKDIKMKCPACGKDIEKPQCLKWHRCPHCHIFMLNGIRKSLAEKKAYHENEQMLHLAAITKKIENIIISQHIHAEPEALEKYKEVIPEIEYFLNTQQIKTETIMEALATVRAMLIKRDKCLDIADTIFKIVQNLEADDD